MEYWIVSCIDFVTTINIADDQIVVQSGFEQINLRVEGFFCLFPDDNQDEEFD